MARWMVAAASLCLLRAANAACSDETLDISWASSSNRIYVNSGCARMADIMDERSDNTGAKGPLYHFDMDANTIVDSYTGTYYLTSHIHIRNGATLEIDGDHPDDGDCEILLMAAGPNYIGTDSLNIRAHGGNLVISKTKIFSWDIDLGDYDTNTDDGRPYISAITEFITGREVDLCNDDELKGTEGYSTGEAKENMGVARMDIYNSELAYLGWDNSESYGVSYKARGLCKTLSNLDIFDDDQPFDYAVYGDIKKSELHHNYFGHYSYGHQGGKWTKNKVHDNIGYGFDPHDDSDHLLIRENEVYNNGWHGIIASKRCTDVDIKMNKVYNNGQNGIMLHRSCDRANVKNNVVWDNGDAGIALYESSDSSVTLNNLTGNVQGIRWSNGANRNYVFRNQIWHDSDDGYAVYMYKGSDEPLADGNENGDILENSFHRNTVYSGRSEALKITYAHDNSFLNNVITEGEYARFTTATNNKWKRNPVPDDFYFDIDEDNSCMGPNDEGLETC